MTKSWVFIKGAFINAVKLLLTVSDRTGESGSQLEVGPQGEFQAPETQVQLKLDNDNL